MSVRPICTNIHSPKNSCVQRTDILPTLDLTREANSQELPKKPEPGSMVKRTLTIPLDTSEIQKKIIQSAVQAGLIVRLSTTPQKDALESSLEDDLKSGPLHSIERRLIMPLYVSPAQAVLGDSAVKEGVSVILSRTPLEDALRSTPQSNLVTGRKLIMPFSISPMSQMVIFVATQYKTLINVNGSYTLKD